MTALRPMSWQTFEAHRTELFAVVNLLLDQDNRRKLRRLVGVYQLGRRSDVPIGEVFNTPHGDLFVGRMTMDDEKGYRDGDPDSRQSRFRAPEPITGDPQQSFDICSYRGQFKVSAQVLISAVEAGRARIYLEPGRFTRVLPPE